MATTKRTVDTSPRRPGETGYLRERPGREEIKRVGRLIYTRLVEPDPSFDPREFDCYNAADLAQFDSGAREAFDVGIEIAIETDARWAVPTVVGRAYVGGVDDPGGDQQRESVVEGTSTCTREIRTKGAIYRVES